MKKGMVCSGPGAARTILRFHIISARPSKQPLMVRTFLKVYMKLYMELGSYILFLQEQIKDIIINPLSTYHKLAGQVTSRRPLLVIALSLTSSHLRDQATGESASAATRQTGCGSAGMRALALTAC